MGGGVDKDFWNVYISLFKKKPLVYVEATIANSFGYYAIIPPLPASIHDAPTNGTPGSRFEFYINRDPDKGNEVVQVSYIPFLETARKKLEKYAYGVRDIPVINLGYSLGFYTWMYVVFILFFIKERKSKYTIAFLPAVLVILVCVASPVNDCLRYFLPAIALMPIMLGLTVYHQNEK